MKKVSGKVRLELAQYRELAAFSQFGSDLDKDTRSRLEHGARLMEMLKQGQYAPVKVEHQVMIIFAATNKYLVDIEVEDVRRFEKQLYEFMDLHHAEIGKAIKTSGAVDAATETLLKAALEEFKLIFKNQQ
jgi:F-type H+-transporting ATPase subunit alpha